MIGEPKLHNWTDGYNNNNNNNNNNKQQTTTQRTPTPQTYVVALVLGVKNNAAVVAGNALLLVLDRDGVGGEGAEGGAVLVDLPDLAANR